MWKPDICLFHMPCDDGFASAWVARKRWPDIQLVPTNYGMSFPDINIVGKNLLVADFSYKPDVLAELASKARSIVILDHHKSAAADLTHVAHLTGPADALGEQFPDAITNVVCRFDIGHSGAALTWEFCFPNDPAPVFIQFIEDRDLWLFKLRETRAFTLYLKSFPCDFDVWTTIADRIAADPNLIMGEALSIERFYDQKIAEIVPTATLKTIGKWEDVPVAHAPYAFTSDVAHELLKVHPSAPFAAVIVDAYGGRTYSLRSEDTRQDVSEVARTFGGGGHRNAAGFRVPL